LEHKLAPAAGAYFQLLPEHACTLLEHRHSSIRSRAVGLLCKSLPQLSHILLPSILTASYRSTLNSLPLKKPRSNPPGQEKVIPLTTPRSDLKGRSQINPAHTKEAISVRVTIGMFFSNDVAFFVFPNLRSKCYLYSNSYKC
jgi:hypothetical protein